MGVLVPDAVGVKMYLFKYKIKKSTNIIKYVYNIQRGEEGCMCSACALVTIITRGGQRSSL